MIVSLPPAFAAAKAWRTEEPAEDLSEGEDEAAGTDEDESQDEPIVVREETTQQGYETGNEDGDEDPAPPEPSVSLTPVLFSTFMASFDNVKQRNNGLELTLTANETIAFVGQYELKVCAGTVTIYGAILDERSPLQHVYAPTTHPLPIIQSLAPGATLRLTSSASTIAELGRLSPLYRKIWMENKHVEAALKENPKLASQTLCGNTFTFIRSSIDDTRPIRPLESPPGWKSVIHDELRPTRGRPKQIMVIGRKDSGKSTFCRTLLNHVLTRDHVETIQRDEISAQTATACWLDLDPGQSEFSPPGQISLVQVNSPVLGPPYTHAYTEAFTHTSIVHAHCIGATSPVDDPERYLACVADLQRRYQVLLQHFPDCSLIINCPGWSTRGFGLEMVLQLLQQVRRTDLVKIGVTSIPHLGDKDPVRVATRLDKVYQVPAIPASAQPATRTAADLREMQIISYLHSIPVPFQQQQWDTQQIEDQDLWTLRYSGDDAEILGISTLIDHAPNPDLLATMLDHWMVALCVVDDDDEVDQALAKSDRTENEKLPYWQLQKAQPTYRPSIEHLRMLGWAYVSAINVEQAAIELKTPLSQRARRSLSKTANGAPRLILVRGQTDPPGWIYLEKIYFAASKKKQTRSDAAPKKMDIRPAYNGLLFHEDVEIDVSQLPQHCDVAAVPGDEMDYVRTTTRGAAAAAGEKHWTQRPRISRARAPAR